MVDFLESFADKGRQHQGFRFEPRQSARHQIEQQIILVDQADKVLERTGSNHRNVPYTGLFETRDKRHYSFSAVTPASSLAILRAMGMDGDARFNTFDACMQHRESFTSAVKGWMASHTLEEVDCAFRANDAAGSPVMSAADLLVDPHVNARGMVLSVPDPQLGTVRMQGIVPKLSETPGEVRHAGQQLGESNEEIYGELLGMNTQQIEQLKTEGVI